MEYFKNHNIAKNNLAAVYKFFPFIVFLSYFVVLIFSLVFAKDVFMQILLVPAFVFVFVSALRVLINEKRPYESYGVSSVFGKQTVGKSMPSRHTASAFIISMAILRLNLTAGIIYLAISCAIAVSRVLSGVHYIRDVLVGAVISVLIGLIFLFLI